MKANRGMGLWYKHTCCSHLLSRLRLQGMRGGRRAGGSWELRGIGGKINCGGFVEHRNSHQHGISGLGNGEIQGGGEGKRKGGGNRGKDAGEGGGGSVFYSYPWWLWICRKEFIIIFVE
jgi:hypothetical protein